MDFIENAENYLHGKYSTNNLRYLADETSQQEVMMQIADFFSHYSIQRNQDNSSRIVQKNKSTTILPPIKIIDNSTENATTTMATISDHKGWGGHFLVNNSSHIQTQVDLHKPEISSIIKTLLGSDHEANHTNSINSITTSHEKVDSSEVVKLKNTNLPVPIHLLQAMTASLAQTPNYGDTNKLPEYLAELKPKPSSSSSPINFQQAQPLVINTGNNDKKENNVKKTTYYYEEVDDDYYEEEESTHLSQILDELSQSELMKMPQQIWNGTKEGLTQFAESFDNFSLPTKMILVFSVSVSVLSIVLGIYSLGPPIIGVGVLGIVIPLTVLALLQKDEKRVAVEDKKKSKVSRILRLIQRGYNLWG